MDIMTRLRAIPFMAHLSASDRHALGRFFTMHRFIAGEDILRQGDFTTRFFIIDEGNVHFRKTDLEGFEQPFGSRGPGGYFGMQMFTSQEPADYTAEAIGQASLYVLEHADYEKLIQANPEILQRLPEVAAEIRKRTRGFTWLTPGETVSLTTHRHPITLLRVLIVPGLVGLLGIGLVVVLSLSGVIGRFGMAGLDVVLGAIILVIAGGWAAYNGFDWADDDFIVTNKRIVHSEQMPLVSGIRNEIPIDKIQSLTINITDALDSALGVGTIEIQSAGIESGKIAFDHVGNVEHIRSVIESQRGRLRGQHQAEDRERFRRRVSNQLSHYVLNKPIEEKPVPQLPPGPRGFRARARAVRRSMFAYVIKEGNTTTWRKHWIALFRQAWIPLVGVILILILIFGYFNIPVLRIVPAQGFFAVFVFLFLLAFGDLIWQWADWRNDIYQVNDTSIVDIERLPFGFRSRETTALLVNIQDARVLRPALINTLLNFGNVEVQVAGGGPPMVFYDVPSPQEISAELFRRLESFHLRQRERETNLQSRNVVDALVAYHRLLMAERHGDKDEPANDTTGVQPPALPDTPAAPIQPGPSALTVVPQEDMAPVSEFPPAEEFDE